MYANDCIEYVLDNESEDFYAWVQHNKFKFSEWKTLNHIFVSALLASDNEPENWELED